MSNPSTCTNADCAHALAECRRDIALLARRITRLERSRPQIVRVSGHDPITHTHPRKVLT